MGDYPSELVLEQIREYDCITEPIGPYLDLITSEWWHPDIGIHRDDSTLYLSTLGWSGNEEIIGAMEQNFSFWSLAWMKSERGGHYTFTLEPFKKMKQNQAKAIGYVSESVARDWLAYSHRCPTWVEYASIVARKYASQE